MGIFGTNWHKKDTGFTIVELLTVIVVIGILMSLVLIVYPGYQKRTRDNERKSDLNQLATALGTYAFQKNSFVGLGSGCGRNGNGNGWIAAGSAQSGAGTYPRSIVECLQDIKALSSDTFLDPTGCIYDSGGTCGTLSTTPVKAYMKATCTKNTVPVTYIFAYLETVPRKDAEVNALCDANSVSGFTATEQQWGTRYAMNYYVAVK